jgi:NAD-dependent dihydropyrimidine dehydrogenase PreA subunit
MKREVVHIDRDLCTGCGDCVPACHEGALQIIDGKAVLVSDLMCDGLGACLGHCPMGAMTIETREAEPYDEVKVMAEMVSKGKNTIIAHLLHLKDHDQTDFMKQGMQYLKENKEALPFDLEDVIRAVHKPKVSVMNDHHSGGCPGSRTMSFDKAPVASVSGADAPSQLRQWPVQLHLVSPMAAYFRQADVVLAADCVAFAMGNFHDRFLKGKSLAIACPKLDQQQDIYVEKLTALIDQAKINTLHVVIMQVPCCGGLLRTAQTALANASRKIPLKLSVISVEGEILSVEWV